MFHFIFKKIYLNIKKDIEEQNAARIASHRLPCDVKISTLPYLDSGNEMHRFNIYKNGRTGGAAPLIVDIHGGGWIAGDKDTNGLFCCRLAEGGFDVSSLSYRNVDSCSIIEQIQDIFAYLHYIENNATALGLSFENVFLSGDSAGGQLALLAYNVNRSAKLWEMFGVSPVNINFKAMALIHSVCYVNMAGKLKNNPVISRLISVPELARTVYGKQNYGRELYNSTCTPTAFITENTPLPPVLLISSAGDEMYSYQTDMLYRDLRALKKDCELYFETDPKAGHVYNIADPDSDLARKCNAHMMNFFKSAMQ